MNMFSMRCNHDREVSREFMVQHVANDFCVPCITNQDRSLTREAEKISKMPGKLRDIERHLLMDLNAVPAFLEYKCEFDAAAVLTVRDFNKAFKEFIWEMNLTPKTLTYDAVMPFLKRFGVKNIYKPTTDDRHGLKVPYYEGLRLQGTYLKPTT